MSVHTLGACLAALGTVLAQDSPRFLRGNATNPSVSNETLQAMPKACTAVPGCAYLSGDCCPAPDGMYLACCDKESWREPDSEDRSVPPGSRLLAMEPSCDHLNVGGPNCGDAASCTGEYLVDGTRRVLKATSTECAYVTFKTQLSLSSMLQLDAETWIKGGTCKELDNLAFWFFQTSESGDALEQPASHWDALSEVDLMETYIGIGGVNSINTNFAATGVVKQWQDFTIVGGVRQHVTMWQDVENTAGCPATRTAGILNGVETVEYGKALPVVSLYVAHCAPGAPCCTGDDCKKLQGAANTAWACITVKDAPVLFALSNWGAGHRVTPGCEIGISSVSLRSK